MDIMDVDQFIGKTIKLGTSLAVTIPSKNVEFAGLKEGDTLKVLFRKIVKETPIEENNKE